MNKRQQPYTYKTFLFAIVVVKLINNKGEKIKNEKENQTLTYPYLHGTTTTTMMMTILFVSSTSPNTTNIQQQQQQEQHQLSIIKRSSSTLWSNETTNSHHQRHHYNSSNIMSMSAFNVRSVYCTGKMKKKKKKTKILQKQFFLLNFFLEFFSIKMLQ